MAEFGSRHSFVELGSGAPALRLAQSFWALQQRNLPVELSLERACADGYTYLEAGLSEERMPMLRRLLKDFPLRLLAQGWATTAADAQPFLERAADLNAVAINMHLGHAYLSTDEATVLVSETSSRAEALRLPLLIETHRGRLTQDLFRFAEVVAQMPEIAIVLDVSHYIVSAETLGGEPPAFHRLLATLTERTAAIHGRVSDGQSVQVQSSDRLAFRDLTCSLWEEAMRSWLLNAPRDAVFLFEPELGPPPYAQRDVSGHELFDRASESAVLRQLAEEAWRRAWRSNLSANESSVSEAEEKPL